MSENNNKQTQGADDYWADMDKSFASAEKKKLLTAVKRSDTEKFYLFTAMLRLNNTLRRVKIQAK